MFSIKPLAKARAISPGKVILLGEHSVSRGQVAIASSIGVYTSCEIKITHASEFTIQASNHHTIMRRETLLALREQVNRLRQDEDYDGLQKVSAANFFAPSLYLLAETLAQDLPSGMEVCFNSQIPISAGMGSGAAAFSSLALAIAQLLERGVSRREIADWAHLGECIAHGGVASRVDIETCLQGGVVQVSAAEGVSSLPYNPSLRLVIGHTGVNSPTNPIKARVREWLALHPHRNQVFEEIGLLSELAVPALAKGDWKRLGHLMNLNQLLLKKMGVSCPEIETLVEAAQSGGAFGAKLSGSGGGGIVIALTDDDRMQSIAQAMQATGAQIFIPGIAVRGTEAG